MKPSRLLSLLVLAFLFGGGSAEMAVQTSRAIARAKAEREVGTAGDFVALEVKGEDGELIARPRLIAVEGRPAQLVLLDPVNPSLVRLALRVETAREASGDIALDWSLELPGRDLSASGKTSVTPGIEQAMELGEVTAKVLTLPVPSAAFDAYVEAEGLKRQPNAI